MDWLRMQDEGLAVAARARPSGRDGVMASPPPPRRRWLLENAGAAFQHVLTASMTKLSTVPYAYEPGPIARLLGAVLEAAQDYGGKVTA
jgi:hypothetical protein